jgi:hypothetical protein
MFYPRLSQQEMGLALINMLIEEDFYLYVTEYSADQPKLMR